MLEAAILQFVILEKKPPSKRDPDTGEAKPKAKEG